MTILPKSNSSAARAVVSVVCIIMFCSFLAACDDVFQFSPYETDLGPREKKLTQKNLKRLATLSSDTFRPFRFAVLADTHSFRDELDDAVSSINDDPSIEFVLVLGDLTDQGLRNEFRWGNEIFSKLRVPHLVIIGNHDTLSNGKTIFREMYGALDYAFKYNDVWFVLYNDNNWEFDHSAPNFDWVETQLSLGVASQFQILASHIGPKSDRFTESELARLYNALEQYGVDLYMFGHRHGYSLDVEEYSGGGTTLILNNGSVGKETYTVVTVNETEIDVERVRL